MSGNFAPISCGEKAAYQRQSNERQLSRCADDQLGIANTSFRDRPGYMRAKLRIHALCQGALAGYVFGRAFPDQSSGRAR